MNTPEHSPLGKESEYIGTYDKSLLFAIPRKEKRQEIGINSNVLPFKGVDVWNAYEISWLNAKGKPVVAIGEFWVPCDSPNIFESKSFKLYLNSFNQTRFTSAVDVQKTLQEDLSECAQAPVIAILKDLDTLSEFPIGGFTGSNLDHLDITIETYNVTPEYLHTLPNEQKVVGEELHTNLLKSNCLITNQPDWASVYIAYTGKKISPEGLLKYVVSFREHNEFHEQCVERIYVDIMKYCQPEQLTVYARYTRRGGIDINPYRSSQNTQPFNTRLPRQ
jgi:7-cyano-7-deazaguanine reductase